MTSYGRFFFSWLFVAIVLVGRVLSAEPAADSRAEVPSDRSDTAPAEFVLIAEGPFFMGDPFAERNPDERPVHAVRLSRFWIQRTEVTFGQWVRVRTWATQHGYEFDSPGAGKADDHPVHSINWYDAVKWCNARSELERRTAAYYADTQLHGLYRRGRRDLTAKQVNWQSNGYRLPTEAEWEKAARGGALKKRFPWGDTIDHQQANYKSSADFPYDLSSSRGPHPKFNDGRRPFTNPVGAFAANDYGLYDISGNVWEWCWDWYDPRWYGNPRATQSDSHGSTVVGEFRAMRGGGWSSEPRNLRCAVRDHGRMAEAKDDRGFRLVRGEGVSRGSSQ